MMREIKAHFDNDNWIFSDMEGKEKVEFIDGFGPYECLLGALSGCYYSTLEDVAAETGVKWDEADIHVSGKKRETVPTTLEDTFIVITVKGADDHEAFHAAAEEASRRCSIFQTIAKVSNMHLAVKFI